MSEFVGIGIRQPDLVRFNKANTDHLSVITDHSSHCEGASPLTSPIHVLGIAGSLRKGSYNKRLLQIAGEVLPAGMTLETFDLAPLPFLNEDIIRESGLPESVQHLHARLAAADAMLIATPEYNFSIPGVLKNAIEWASQRMADGQPSPINDKPLAIMGGGGRLGTARAQLHLRE